MRSVEVKENLFYKYSSVVASFFIMLCLGGVYAWSIFANELMLNHGWTSTQTQLVFGFIIAIFPITMIFAGKFESKLRSRTLAFLSAILLSSGYLLSGLAKGNFYLTLFSFGILTGMGTGCGYLVALTTPVKWFPKKKGLVAGIAAGGFGLAAVLLSFITENLLIRNKSIPEIFSFIGIVYGGIVIFFAFFLQSPRPNRSRTLKRFKFSFRTKDFIQLFLGIFLGTFAGLLIIGNLKNIGAEHLIKEHILIVGVSVFAATNFLGRLFWGALSDYLRGNLSIFSALSFQAIAIFILARTDLTAQLYLLSTAMIGFGFGSNFVLFAKETSKRFGISRLGSIYPYIFLGYAVAGIVGPLTGGLFYDYFESYHWSVVIAAVMSLLGALLFIKIKPRVEKKEDGNSEIQKS